ncbi:MAG: hypothetical protein Q9214_000128 [Letrouitia sp. 1 TL-2023]
MYLLTLILSTLFCFCTNAFSKGALNAFERVQNKRPVIEKRNGNQAFSHPELEKRASRFLNPNTEKFVVDGTKIPDVDFDVGESYAGLLPISQDPNETRQLFFWFFPSSNPAAIEEVTIWFNGGPGCSSLSGFLTENGPFTWEAGTLAPTQNPYTWVNLTNMMWVEQPVGVGYTQGTPNITDEVQLAQEFIGFYKSFVNAFQVQNYKVYLTGESYAGYYVPYIADAFINADDSTYYNLAGVAINDPIIGDGTNQQEVVIVPYVDYWANLFSLNASFTEAIHAKADSCGYTDYFNKYLQYPPPPGPFPVLPDPFASENYTCDIFDDVFSAALEVNPCFNIYHITDTCPHLWSVLGIVNEGDYRPPGEVVYFNRSDVQAAINAPPNTNWYQCTPKNVFGLGTNNQNLSDQSIGPAQNGVLQHVIESINNTIIGSGNLDYILPTNGTLLALQNLTWNGQQGFQKFPENEFYTPYHPEYNGGAISGAGYLGLWGTERGLTFYQVQLGGHGDFTTQQGNYTGSGTIYRDPILPRGQEMRPRGGLYGRRYGDAGGY